jgi:sec-independent protein translocase protein TatA
MFISFFGGLGPTELFIILAIMVLVFGGKKLPGLARAMGSSINQFKHGLKEDSESKELLEKDDNAEEGK